MVIGRLERVPLRDVWKHEEYDFTRWLKDNIDVLSDVVDVVISNIEREQSAGSFSVDLLAEDAAGNAVVIENQLEKSDHDHLGKLITYLTAFEAKTGIWIVAEPRPEHVTAINWLNQTTPASFYLLKVEAVRIEGSRAAPLLTRIVGPSAESRDVGHDKKAISDNQRARVEFWRQLLELAKHQTALHENISPTNQNWITAGGGVSGLGFAYVVGRAGSRVELYIDRGDSGTNKAIFDKLLKHREQIEQVFGEPLKWDRLNERRASRISKDVSTSGYYEDEDRWPAGQTAMVDTMVRFERALRPYLNTRELGL